MNPLTYLKIGAVVAIFFAGWTANGWRLDKRFDEYKMAAEMANRALIIQHEKESDRLQKEKDDAIEAVQIKLNAYRVALDNSVQSHNSLLKSTSVAVARVRAACQNTVPSPGITPTDDPIGVLANVLGRADERAGALGKYADAARIAGESCERQYDSLTPK